ncbi:MaoC family dehydratase [Subtercola boreus]|uniref:Dehydratase n=1 Tax=Subtercola boreus TaxID=120213 RepID=A0A3E0WD88_9MICO|nr:MaoC family dehydratase [Subtercola boreus]RFA22764.1 dehydratase [Subtercola boreus]RFA23119.1 dehydratase [Subtercola boreus]RFA28872.1 dehydratase [Subtercola boreus]
MAVFASLEALAGAVGSDLGTAGPITISQNDIDTFARVTHDEQWIHVDPERAADGPYGTTIAHGFLTLSLASAFLAELLTVEGVSAAINYGLGSVRFPAPVPSGSAVSARGILSGYEEKPGGAEVRVQLTMTVPGGAKPVCVLEQIVRYLR